MVKLVRYGPAGQEKPGLVDADGGIRDLSGEVDDIAGDVLLPEGMARLEALDPVSLPRVDGSLRLGPPVAGVGKIMAIGLNYSDHAAESGLDVPPEPVLFMKATSAISGPNDPVVIPRGSEKTDYEVELAAVVGTPGKYVDEANALDHVAGYCICNDVSEREFQLHRAGQWTKGKSCDTFAPIGPWLVSRDEIADPQKLGLWTKVNGETRQDGNTDKMVYGMKHLLSYLSTMMSLQTGDIVSTGTPPGVGAGFKPPKFLKPGDVMELGVEGLGTQRQELVADD
ncbi:MAG: fumarylacetoacetate hydrolase family protein [Alphaproteobacteria bacterium]|nr:fumarylacetoacetate hydrolase family protein [Alphaproteobacteria bacterium]